MVLINIVRAPGGLYLSKVMRAADFRMGNADWEWRNSTSRPSGLTLLSHRGFSGRCYVKSAWHTPFYKFTSTGINKNSRIIVKSFKILRVQTLYSVSSVAQKSKSNLSHFTVEISRSHTIRHAHAHTHTHARARARVRYNSSALVIGSSQWPAPKQHTTNTRDKHLCFYLVLNPRS
jgi:hypothetical protein